MPYLASANQPLLASGGGSPVSTTNYLVRGVRCSTKQEYLFTKAQRMGHTLHGRAAGHDTDAATHSARPVNERGGDNADASASGDVPRVARPRPIHHCVALHRLGIAIRNDGSPRRRLVGP